MIQVFWIQAQKIVQVESVRDLDVAEGQKSEVVSQDVKGATSVFVPVRVGSCEFVDRSRLRSRMIHEFTRNNTKSTTRPLTSDL